MKTTTTSQPVETTWVCDECAGEGQLAYDMQASLWVPRSATADWPADERMAISVLDCLQCEGTGTLRLDPAASNHPNLFRPVTSRVRPGSLIPPSRSGSGQGFMESVGDP